MIRCAHNLHNVSPVDIPEHTLASTTTTRPPLPFDFLRWYRHDDGGCRYNDSNVLVEDDGKELADVDGEVEDDYVGDGFDGDGYYAIDRRLHRHRHRHRHRHIAMAIASIEARWVAWATMRWIVYRASCFSSLAWVLDIMVAFTLPFSCHLYPFREGRRPRTGGRRRSSEWRSRSRRSGWR